VKVKEVISFELVFGVKKIRFFDVVFNNFINPKSIDLKNIVGI